MAVQALFVNAPGRLSSGNTAALSIVQAIAAQHGGHITGGVGSSQDPIIAEFPDAVSAQRAVQQAFFNDAIEYARLVKDDADPDEDGAAQDQGPSQFPKDFGVREAREAVARVASGTAVEEVIAAL